MKLSMHTLSAAAVSVPPSSREAQLSGNKAAAAARRTARLGQAAVLGITTVPEAILQGSDKSFNAFMALHQLGPTANATVTNAATLPTTTSSPVAGTAIQNPPPLSSIPTTVTTTDQQVAAATTAAAVTAATTPTSYAEKLKAMWNDPEKKWWLIGGGALVAYGAYYWYNNRKTVG